MSWLALGLLAGLAALERKGFLQAMLSRPIALGPLVGLALGDPAAGLAVGAPLELLWLGAVNLGAALPVHEALGTAAIAGATVAARRALPAGGADPATLAAVAALAVLLCAPVALVGRRADRLVEQWNEHLHDRAERALARGDLDAAVGTNLRGLLLPFAVAAALAPVTAAVAGAAIPALLRAAPDAVPPLAVGWIAFGGFACASGAKAMRARRAPAWFLGALAAGMTATAVLRGVAA